MNVHFLLLVDLGEGYTLNGMIYDYSTREKAKEVRNDKLMLKFHIMFLQIYG